MLRVTVVLAALACAAPLAIAQTKPPAAEQPAAPAAAPASAVPALPTVWSESFDGGALRIAVADTRGDGQDRVISLSQVDEERSCLTVFRWDGKRFVAEWQTEFEDTQRLLAAGRFIQGASDAQIVTSGGWYRWAGQDYAYHAFNGSHPPVGALLRPGGGAVLLTWERGGVQMSSIDVDSDTGGGALVSEPDDPTATWSAGLLRARADYLAKLIPSAYAARGLLAFWTGSGKQQRLNALPIDDGKGGGAALVVSGSVAPDALSEDYRSGALPGPVLDLAFGDPKGARTPVLVALVSSGASGNGRMLLAFPASESALRPAAPKPSAPPALERKPAR